MCVSNTRTRVCMCVPVHKQKGQLRLSHPVLTVNTSHLKEPVSPMGRTWRKAARATVPAWEPVGTSSDTLA